jgi:hypothetical protein
MEGEQPLVHTAQVSRRESIPNCPFQSAVAEKLYVSDHPLIVLENDFS